MRDRNKNGQQIAKDNVDKVTKWISERDQLRDWDDYESNGRINRKNVAEELDFARSVTTQNMAVRQLLEEADRRWFQSIPVTKAAQDASLERSQANSRKLTLENNKLTAQVADLEAENRKNRDAPPEIKKLTARVKDLENENSQLRKELEAFRRMHDMIGTGMPGFKL